MELLTLAMKDILRRKGKNLYIAFAVMIPVAILCTILLMLDNADSSLANIASKFGFTLTVQPKNTKAKRIDQIGVVLDEYFAESVIDVSTEVIQRRIAGAQEGLIVAPRLYIKTDIGRQGSAFSSVVAGINYEAEREARSSWRLTKGRWPENDKQVVLGGTLAEVRNLGPGDVVVINSGNFEIAGILENYNSSEDYMLFLPFEEVQRLFEKEDQVSVLNIQAVSLDRDNTLLQSVLSELNNTIPNVKAMTPQQFSAIKYVLLKKTFKFLFSIILATVLASIFSIFNIITAALYSRVKEIGLLKSAGASRGQLLRVFLYEYCLIGVVGGAVGYPMGLLMSFLSDSFLLDIGTSIRFSFPFFVLAVFMGCMCSLFASVYPTVKLSGIKITEAFRSQWEV